MFCALLEFALVNYASRSDMQRDRARERMERARRQWELEHADQQNMIPGAGPPPPGQGGGGPGQGPPGAGGKPGGNGAGGGGGANTPGGTGKIIKDCCRDEVLQFRFIFSGVQTASSTLSGAGGITAGNNGGMNHIAAAGLAAGAGNSAPPTAGVDTSVMDGGIPGFALVSNPRSFSILRCIIQSFFIAEKAHIVCGEQPAVVAPIRGGRGCSGPRVPLPVRPLLRGRRAGCARVRRRASADRRRVQPGGSGSHQPGGGRRAAGLHAAAGLCLRSPPAAAGHSHRPAGGEVLRGPHEHVSATPGK